MANIITGFRVLISIALLFCPVCSPVFYMKWQLVEEYGVGSFEEQPDGSLLFEHEYSDDEGLISWMLSCRDKVTVIEPESVRDKLYQIACDMAEKYATAVSEAEPCGAFERREKNHGKQSADDN